MTTTTGPYRPLPLDHSPDTALYTELVAALNAAGYHSHCHVPDPLGVRLTVPAADVEIYHPEHNVAGPDPRTWVLLPYQEVPTEEYADADTPADAAGLPLDIRAYQVIDVADGPDAHAAIVAVLDRATRSTATVV